MVWSTMKLKSNPIIHRAGVVAASNTQSVEV